MAQAYNEGDRVRVLVDGASGSPVRAGDIGDVVRAWGRESVDVKFGGRVWALGRDEVQPYPLVVTS